MSQLSQKLGVSMSAMTQIADRLERAGFVARYADDTDRRVRCLTLTGEGRRALQAHQKVQQKRLALAYSQMPEAARRKLVTGLQHLKEACATVRAEIEAYHENVPLAGAAHRPGRRRSQPLQQVLRDR